MKNKFAAFLLLISSITIAQNTIEGFISPNLESDWVILYRIEGTQQVFINNTTIKKEALMVNGKEQSVGTFAFNLPANAKSGTYRATYKLEGAGFIDFYYNKEDVSFIFNPDYPRQSVAFTKSEENKLYKNYIEEITVAQEKIDSIQVAYIRDKSLDLQANYATALNNFKAIQTKFEALSQGKYTQDFIKASPRVNAPKLLTSANAYLDLISSSFFDRLDFSNSKLINSSFLTNRILDYIFYINYTEDPKEQEGLYKKSIVTVLSKITDKQYKRDIIAFLIEQFETQKNISIIDYLFQEHYNKLPKNLQNEKFKNEKEALFAAEIGRTAPDFSWTENGQKQTLLGLKDATQYILVFWSTGCSHCLREIPELHSYMKDKTNFKVVAFALEKDEFVWQQYSKANLKGWHNVLGLNKWENKTARTYQINATPSYFVLDKNKKIIAKPYELKDVKAFLEKQ